MAEGGSDEIVEKLICGLCFEAYRQPRLLPCFDSFCLNCLEDYVKVNLRGNKEFSCPLCEKVTEVPVGGVRNFQPNVYIDRDFGASGEENHSCDLCGPNIGAVNYCAVCEEYYCEKCTDIHMKQKATRAHSLVNYDVTMGSSSKGFTLVKKKTFCEKHANEEVRVMCKDCYKTVCVLCKVTEHERHDSTEVTDEAKAVKKDLKDKVKEADGSILKLDSLLDRLKELKDESYSTREKQLDKIREYEVKVKEIIEAKVKELKDDVDRQYSYVSTYATSSITNTLKLKASFQNITKHSDQMIAASDNVSLIRNSTDIQKRMEECLLKTKRHVSKEQPKIQDLRSKRIPAINEFLSKSLYGVSAVTETKKEVSVAGMCHFNALLYSNNICSLAVQKFCATSSSDCRYMCTVDSPGSYLKKQYEVGRFLLCLEEDRCFFSHTEKKEIKQWNRTDGQIESIRKVEMYPHGLAYRTSENGTEELIVCCLKDDIDIMSTNQSKGSVKVYPLPTSDKKQPYTFLTETSPAPSRIAVSKFNGLVCLCCPSVGKITVHSDDGTIFTSFDGSAYGNKLDTFRPFGVWIMRIA